jgi:carbamoyl-phosphate synthase large subunit
VVANVFTLATTSTLGPLPDSASAAAELVRPRPRILLGTAGTSTSWGIASSLRERWGDRLAIVATDMLPGHLVATSALTERFVQVPEVSDDRFVPVLLSLIEQESINTYVPTFDAEIVLAARLREGGALKGVRVLAPPLWAAQTCWDKRAAAAWLQSAGLPAPDMLPFAAAAWRPGGAIVKPRRGVGSVGVMRVSERDQWEALCQRDDLEDWIAQELIDGPEVTLDCFRSTREQRSRVVCRERVEVKSGVCTKARVFDDPGLASTAVAIGAGLELGGVYCLQAMRCPRRGWLVTDINPRPGAGTRLSAAVGVLFVAAWFADAWGLPTAGLLPPLDHERWVVRQYQEIVLG